MRTFRRGEEIKLDDIMIAYWPPDEGQTLFPWRANYEHGDADFVEWGRTPGEALDNLLGLNIKPTPDELGMGDR